MEEVITKLYDLVAKCTAGGKPPAATLRDEPAEDTVGEMQSRTHFYPQHRLKRKYEDTVPKLERQINHVRLVRPCFVRGTTIVKPEVNPAALLPPVKVKVEPVILAAPCFVPRSRAIVIDSPEATVAVKVKAEPVVDWC